MNQVVVGGGMPQTLGEVLLELLGSRGAQTDDSLRTLYSAAGHPEVSPQRLRTARAALVRRGFVRPAGVGMSELGNVATLWEVVE